MTRMYWEKKVGLFLVPSLSQRPRSSRCCPIPVVPFSLLGGRFCVIGRLSPIVESGCEGRIRASEATHSHSRQRETTEYILRRANERRQIEAARKMKGSTGHTPQEKAADVRGKNLSTKAKKETLRRRRPLNDRTCERKRNRDWFGRKKRVRFSRKILTWPPTPKSLLLPLHFSPPIFLATMRRKRRGSFRRADRPTATVKLRLQ